MKYCDVQERTFQFSYTVIKWLRELPHNIEAAIIRRQLLRSATSIGANITEARHALTRREYIQYLQIVLRSSRESEYWLRLCRSVGNFPKMGDNDIYSECCEISKILATMLVCSKGIKDKLHKY